MRLALSESDQEQPWLFTWEMNQSTKIMMIGRWSSNAFLWYSQKQVEQFSQNLLEKMIKHQFYCYIPEVNPTIPHMICLFLCWDMSKYFIMYYRMFNSPLKIPATFSNLFLHLILIFLNS